jgi:hypothetical protein
VCQWLASGSGFGGSLAGVGEVLELSTGLCRLILDVLRNRAYAGEDLSVSCSSQSLVSGLKETYR